MACITFPNSLTIAAVPLSFIPPARPKEEDLNRIIQEPTEDSKAEVDWRLQDSSRVWELSSHREEFKNLHKTLRLK